jgi:hypothetical protein
VPNNVRKDNMTCVGNLINRHCIIKATHCLNFVGNDSYNENYGAVPVGKVEINPKEKIVIHEGLAKDFRNGERTTQESREHTDSSPIPTEVEHRLFVNGNEVLAWGYTNEPSATYQAGHSLSRQCGGTVDTGICFKIYFLIILTNDELKKKENLFPQNPAINQGHNGMYYLHRVYENYMNTILHK